MPRWIPIVTTLALAACSGSAPEPTHTATPTLKPRSTATPSPSAAARPPGTPLVTPGPSPTPLIHVVEQGDTLLGIAIIYGVELADLVLANPDVNPRFLSVGTGLLIPSTGVQSSIATATPYPLTLSPARCFAELDGGLWCFTLATTSGSQPVEAVIALISLIGSGGETLRTEPAFSPINLLDPRSALPLAAYFAPPVPDYHSSSALLVSGLQASGIDQRYAALELEIAQRQIAGDRASGVIIGTARLAEAEAALEVGLRLVAVALDADRQPVGYRVWEIERTAGLAGGIEFELMVASMGPPIQELLLLAEAR